MILNIRKIGDPVLRTKSREVAQVTAQTREILDNMAETMYAAPGVGLAAPQVGILQRLVVIDVGEDYGLVQLINPHITEYSEEKEIIEEGCLSVPGQEGAVSRSKTVTVKALNRDGKEIEIKAEGYLARAIQHEVDHLDGILFVDKVREQGVKQ